MREGVGLRTLLEHLAEVPPGAESVCVSGLTQDSRAVRPGDLFLALPGTRSHGLAHAAEAAARGARAVLWDPAGAAAGPGLGAGPAAGPGPALPAGVFAAPVPGLARLVGAIADRFFGAPSARLKVVGITGTNGKTTCAWLLAQCLERLGRKAGYIGTLGWGRPAGGSGAEGAAGAGGAGGAAGAGAAGAGGAVHPALAEPTHTTPDTVEVHRLLEQLSQAGVEAVAMEVSSHALEQGRIDGVRVTLAAFTNLTRDHLDYHGSMDAYGAAKARLFKQVGLQAAVINVGDAFGRELAQRVSVPLIAVAVDATVFEAAGELAAADELRGAVILVARRVELDLRGIALEVEGTAGQVRLATRLLGRFNAENALVVLGCLVGLGVPLAEAARVLAQCQPAPGRMELVESRRPGRPLAVVDYAHTPDALEKALGALREHCRGALWCVFGCGGDRDRGKRAQMGAIADALADQLIVTDDNPRSEAPEAIVREILAGFRVHRPRVIHDRAQAIATALTEARANDMVLIAGKGHEPYQIYGGTRRPFSDRREAQKCLEVAA